MRVKFVDLLQDFMPFPKLYIRIFLNSINSHPYENLDRGDYEKKNGKMSKH